MGPHYANTVLPVLLSNQVYVMQNNTRFTKNDTSLFYGSTFDSTAYNWSISLDFSVTVFNGSVVGKPSGGFDVRDGGFGMVEITTYSDNPNTVGYMYDPNLGSAPAGAAPTPAGMLVSCYWNMYNNMLGIRDVPGDGGIVETYVGNDNLPLVGVDTMVTGVLTMSVYGSAEMNCSLYIVSATTNLSVSAGQSYWNDVLLDTGGLNATTWILVGSSIYSNNSADRMVVEFANVTLCQPYPSPAPTPGICI